MNTYLTIMATILTAAQIVRVIQNAIQMHRQEENQVEKEINLSAYEFEVQKQCTYLLRDWLVRQARKDYGRAEDDT